jgi:hypothetical protein
MNTLKDPNNKIPFTIINIPLFYIIFLFFTIQYSLFTVHCSLAQLYMGIPDIAGKPAGTMILRDYEAIGVNPANLGLKDNNRVSVGIGYFGGNLQSKVLNFDEIKNDVINLDILFTPNQKLVNSLLFSTPDALNFNANFTWMGASVNLNRLGGIAVSLRDRIGFHFTANKGFSDVLFNGVNSNIYSDPKIFSKKISDVFDGTNILFIHTRELNIAYGVRITNLFDDIAIYGGIGYRYIWGLGLVDFNISPDNFTAVSSLGSSNYQINKGAIDSFSISNPNYLKNIFNSAGRGSAFDIGGNIVFLNKLKFGLSFNDIGSITWNKNVLQASNSNMKKLDPDQKGLKSYNAIEQIGYLFNSDGLMDFTASNTFVYKLPGTYRMGVSFKPTNNFEIGADMVTPINKVDGYKDYTYYSLGAQFDIIRILKLNAGVLYNAESYWHVPFGLTLSTRGYFDIYLATDDVLTYLNRNKYPVYSAALCVFRFNIPKKVK